MESGGTIGNIPQKLKNRGSRRILQTSTFTTTAIKDTYAFKTTYLHVIYVNMRAIYGTRHKIQVLKNRILGMAMEAPWCA
jgi:hypothetical protein